jgi:signal transduction histidine kinase
MKTNIEDNDILDFYSVFQDFVYFSESNFLYSKLSDIIKNGMSVLNKFAFLIDSSVYLLNNETLEFDVKYEYSLNPNQKNIPEHFNDLVENGIIGDALQNCKLSQFYNEEPDSFFLVFPLISIDGVLGLIILNCASTIEKIKINVFNIVKILSFTLANLIYSFNLRETNKRNDNLIEQVIASRTKELVEDQQVLDERIEKMKANLSMSLPHEFRTPINQIHGFSNYLVQHFSNQKGEDFEDIIEIVNDIKDSATRLKFSFENYLYYAKLFIISANLEDIQQLQTNVTYYADTVIFEYVMLVAYKYNRANETEINAIEATLAISEEHFLKLLQEIADNCFKFSQPGTNVKISTNIEKNYYFITFEDAGIGLKTDDIGHIDAYMQFERTRNEQQGLGLGLSIVRKILDIYHGTIDFKSELDKYTKVLVSIPIAVLDTMM